MRSRTAQALTVGGVAVIVTGAVYVGAFGGSPAGEETAPSRDRSGRGADAAPAHDRTKAEGRYRAVIELPDGRRVEIRFVKKKGLGERHFDAKTRKWSGTKLIYRTDSDPCQGIRLSAHGGTVAATADFGLFCYDGEPPEKSIAAVGTGDFTQWAANRHDRSDGWEKVSVARTGERVSFVRRTEKLIVTLRWSKEGGFARPEEKPRPPTRLSEKFFGSWKADDGSQRMVVQKRGNGGVATFFSQGRDRCVTRVGLYQMSKHTGQFIEVYRAKGERSKGCPMYSSFEFLKLNKAGTEPNRRERKLPRHAPAVRSVDRDWLGDWELDDGGRRITIEEPQPGKPTVTFTGPGDCVARSEVSAGNDGESFTIVGTRPAKRLKGESASDCPPTLGEFTLSRDGRTFSQQAGGQNLTYVRSTAKDD